MANIGSQPKGVKIREFQWLQVEARVRQFVHELMTPFQKRLLQATANTVETKRESRQLKAQLADLNVLLNEAAGGNKSLSFLENIDSKFMESEQRQLADRERLQQLSHLVTDKLHSYGGVAEKAEQSVVLSKQLREKLSVELLQLSSGLSDFKAGIQSLVKDNNEQLVHLKINFQNTQRAAEERILKEDNYFRQQDLATKKLEAMIRSLESKQVLQSQANSKFRNELKGLTDEHDRIRERVDQNRKSLCVTQDLKTEMRGLCNYVEKYLPLENQLMLSECLSACLGAKEKKALLVFQNRTYNLINDQLLQDDGEPDLEGKQARLKERGQEVFKRVSRQYQRLKNENRGEEGDFENPNERGQVARDEFGEQKARQMLESLLQERLAQNMKAVRLQVEESKKWLQESQEQVQRLVEQFSLKQERSRAELLRGFSECQVQTRALGSELDAQGSSLKQIRLQLEGVADALKDMYNFSTVINHVIIQDEIDRQAISLYGLKESNGPVLSRAVDLEEKCLSCSGYPASVIAAFKMACLSYKPSPVRIEATEYSRHQILELSSSILQLGKSRLMTGSGSRPKEEETLPRLGQLSFGAGEKLIKTQCQPSGGLQLPQEAEKQVTLQMKSIKQSSYAY